MCIKPVQTFIFLVLATLVGGFGSYAALQADQAVKSATQPPAEPFDHPFCRQSYVSPGSRCAQLIKDEGLEDGENGYGNKVCAGLYGTDNSAYDKCLRDGGEKPFSHTFYVFANALPIMPLLYELGGEFTLNDHWAVYGNLGMVFVTVPVSVEAGIRWYSRAPQLGWFLGAGVEYWEIAAFTGVQIFGFPMVGGYRWRFEEFDLGFFAGFNPHIYPAVNASLIGSFLTEYTVRAMDWLWKGMWPTLGVDISFPIYRMRE